MLQKAFSLPGKELKQKTTSSNLRTSSIQLRTGREQNPHPAAISSPCTLLSCLGGKP